MQKLEEKITKLKIRKGKITKLKIRKGKITKLNLLLMKGQSLRGA